MSPGDRFKAWLKETLSSMFVKPAIALFTWSLDIYMDDPRIPPETREVWKKHKAAATTEDTIAGAALALIGGIPAIMGAGRPIGRTLEYYQDRLEKSFRLDPISIMTAWKRDKAAYEKYFNDLKDQGWNDERIEVFKTLAYLIPSATDLVRMAVREVFTPEIVAKYGQMEDFPPDFAKWGEKIGLTQEWAKNYWAAHWDLPSATQGYEMLHRGVITYEDLEVLLRTLDVMPYWRDKLIKIAYSPFTRVDVRRMYKLGILDRDGVKRAYMDIGFDDEKAEAMTEFTIAYYAKPTTEEADLEDEENAKNRDLTRADICDGYNRRMLARIEATDSLSVMGYDADEIDFYLDREDLKRDQELKNAYARNYHDLYVTGVIDNATVKSDLVTLGLEAAEVDELLKLWYIERIRRAERPSRTDLTRFLKKGIITKERYRIEMANLGYSEQYIDWYLWDITG